MIFDYPWTQETLIVQLLSHLEQRMQSDVLLCSVRSRLVWKFFVCISVKSSAGLQSIFLVPKFTPLVHCSYATIAFFPHLWFAVFSEGRCFSTIYPVVVCTKVGKLPMHAWLSTFRPWNKGFQESSLLLKEI